MENFYKPGDYIDYVNAGSAISAGDIVQAGDIIGVAVNDIAASTGVGPLLIKGIIKVTKTGSQAWTLGQTVYYAGSNTFTTVASGNARAGVAAAAVGSGSGETTGYVLINTTPGLDIGEIQSHIADPASAAAMTQDTLTLTSMTGTANTTPAAETNLAALTLTSMTGTANTTPAAETNIDTIGGTLTGTLDNTLADCTATNSGDVSATINKNFKEIQAELVTQKALNTVLINDVKLFAEELVKQKALNTVLINDVKLFAEQLVKIKTDVAAVRTGSEANNTAIDSINAALAAFKVTAAS